MKLLSIFALLITCLNAIGQTFPAKKPLTFYPGTYIDTEARYTDSNGINVIVQNSEPKWATPLLDSMTRTQGFSCLAFFSRIVNEGNDTIELTIDFPLNAFPSPASPDAYLKIFLPRDTMRLDKEGLFAYGLTSLESLADNVSAKPTTFHRTIPPRQDCVFYVVLLFYSQQGFFGIGTRAGFTVESQNLFYKINQLNFMPIPCGHVVPKKH